MEENIFNTVEEPVEQIGQDDAAQAASTSEGTQALSSILESEHPEADEQGSQKEEPAKNEPKEEQGKEPVWFRRQLNAERKKWEQEKADYEARLAEYAEKDLEAEAEKLAAEENISKNIALRILRAEKNLPTPAPKEKPERNRTPDGKFAKADPKEEPTQDAEARERAQELMRQNEVVLKATGVNALELYQQNEKVRQKVNSGEWDFADVAKEYLAQSGVRKIPAPIKTPNGVSLRAKSIKELSDEEFAKLNEKLEMGYVIDPGR